MGPDWLRLVTAVACGVTCFAVRRRGFAPVSAGLLFAGAMLLICSATSETVSAGLFAFSLLATPLAPCVVGVAGLWWPVRRPGRWLLGVGVAVLAGGLAAGLLQAVGLDTRATGCSACPVNPLMVQGLVGSAGALDRGLVGGAGDHGGAARRRGRGPLVARPAGPPPRRAGARRHDRSRRTDHCWVQIVCGLPRRRPTVGRVSGLALKYVAAQARLQPGDGGRPRCLDARPLERSRLERDLHDGAQQALIALSMQVTAGAGPHQNEAQREITAALHDLRTIARGLFPVSLSEAGLSAGPARARRPHCRAAGGRGRVHGPARRGRRHRALRGRRRHRGCGAMDQAASCRSAVRRGRPTGSHPGRLAEPAAQPDGLLERAEDRVVALGGTLTVNSTPDGLVVEGEIPCGS